MLVMNVISNYLLSNGSLICFKTLKTVILVVYKCATYSDWIAPVFETKSTNDERVKT